MCGIAGIVTPGTPPPRAGIESMARALIHRGPDETGFFQEAPAALSIQRLSIIDLVSGSQPQASPDGRHTIVFNGEIYNHAEVRAELETKGFTFRTHSDTEVILQAYLAYGEKCLARLNGMFAFAIWDKLERVLFLARDRLGVKPLYYTFLKDRTFLFASEIKAFLRVPAFLPERNPQALSQILTLGFPLTPDTFFKGVHSVLPGHFLKLKDGQAGQVKYWELDPFAPKRRESADELAEELRARLETATKRRLVSDVPVAAYLSGGIDSSAIVALYSKLAPGKIKTFSIGFGDPAHNELPFAKQVSEHFHTDHFAFECAPPTPEDFRELVWHLEDPLVTLLQLPLFSLSQAVQNQGFKVVLSGDGADEVLGGYDYFGMFKTFHFIQKNRASKNRLKLLSRFNPALQHEEAHSLYFAMLQNQLKKLPPHFPSLPYVFHLFQDTALLFSQSFHRELRAAPPWPLFFDTDALKALSPMDQLFYLETKLRLLNLTLPLSDKMSMANSVENHSPFLDYPFVEFCHSLPASLKVQGLQEKFILKKAFRDFLPEEILSRKKKPLTAPLSWALSKLGESMRESLSEKTLRDKGYFNPDYVALLQQVAASRNVDSSGVLFMIHLIHTWDDLFFKENR